VAPGRRARVRFARIWRGATPESKADAYFEYLKRTGVPAYRATKGNRGVFVFRRTKGKRAEFLIVTLWDSFDAIRRFAGLNPERPVYYPEDKDFLLRLERTVDHYDVLLAE